MSGICERPGEAVRVVLVVGVRLYLESVAELLRKNPAFEVVGSFGSVSQALAALPKLEPDVMLFDMGMHDGLSGVSTARKMRPPLRILALNVAEDPCEVVACAEAGVSGFLPRDGSAAELTRVVEDAVRGELRCSAKIAAGLLRHVGLLASNREEVTETSRLTPRELEVAKLIDLGFSNKEIASRLSIEVSTVKNHVHKVLEKSNARRRGEAAARLRPRLTDLFARRAAMDP